MENHKEGMYSTNYISQWICNNFDLRKKNPTKRGMLCQINNEVSSNFSKLMKPTCKRQLNFEQHPGTKGEFYYSFKENKKLKLPSPKEIVAPNPYETNKILKPTQTSFKFDQKEEIGQREAPLEETTIMEENSPLFEDIIAADLINKEEDIVSRILENYQKMNIYNLEEITFITTRDKKKVTINISNI